MKKALLYAIALCGGIAAAQAQPYPAKAVSLVVPFPAGGRTDVIGRIVAQQLSEPLGSSVVVINKPGAGGVLGAQEVSQARADGYTLGFFSSAFVTAQYTVAPPIVSRDYDLLAIVSNEIAGIVAGVTGGTSEGYPVDLELLLLPLRHRGRQTRQIGVLAPLSVPFWLGASQITALALKSHRHVGAALEALPTTPFMMATESRRAPKARVIEDLILIAECSSEGEWAGQIRHLPL